MNIHPPGTKNRPPHRPGDYGRAAEAFIMLALASLTIRFIPFRYFSRWLGQVEAAGSPAQDPASETAEGGAPPPLAWSVALAVKRAARRAWWHPTCLARAMAGRALLTWRGIPATVTFGVSPGKDGAPLTAHAWLVCGEATLLGGEAAPTFHPIAHFKSPAKGDPT
ncbi:lasso peptide biosynthesis B2 protein [Rhodospirillum sp. A1_3_36]|uniref:lasso peptide biosynthesis B2 protein n=1 Tax=Rhodospirillum sp. A1_3_36 TaxID=3391666 RepID=UPI0039A4DF4D